jgi:hypothetical protein
MMRRIGGVAFARLSQKRNSKSKCSKENFIYCKILITKIIEKLQNIREIPQSCDDFGML